MKIRNTYHSIDAHEADYLYKQPSQVQNSGFGLFTAIHLYREETVALFTGKILSNREALDRVEKGVDQYFINLLDGSIMDSRNSKCFAKYANDANGPSKSHFTNNTRITLDEDEKVCIQAIRDIAANEELFCSYGKKYWKRHANR